MSPIYLDHCSTTPIDPTILDAMMPFLRELYGNPGTPHQEVGGVVQRAIREARELTAQLINSRANELIWTSGATEANNLAILGCAVNTEPGKRHIVTQVTEHSAVLEPCRHLEANGWDVTYLPVDKTGQVDVAQLNDAINDATSLVSIMWGNNEIGTIQPVRDIANLCAERGVLFHCDSAQAIGKVVIDVEDVPVSMLTISAHKFYGPKGVGALYIRDLNKRTLISPQMFGGGQEKGLRAGTLNVPSIVGMGAACSLAAANMGAWSEHTCHIRNHFETLLFEQLTNTALNGSQNERLPHISNIYFQGCDNEGLLTMLPELVASTGSACHVADFSPSHVLVALCKMPDVTECSVRFGFGKENTEADIETSVDLICEAVRSLRNS